MIALFCVTLDIATVYNRQMKDLANSNDLNYLSLTPLCLSEYKIGRNRLQV